MLVIVSNTTPLNYLVQIDAADILPRLYTRVLIPAAVREELNQPNTPENVRSWVAQSRPWPEEVRPSLAADPALSHLDEGEIQAIALALEYRADLLLMTKLSQVLRGDRKRQRETDTRHSRAIGNPLRKPLEMRRRQTGFPLARE